MECLLCGDSFPGRVRVWQDDLWRLSVVDHGAVVGFAHLEPLRHIPSIVELDGPEAVTLGGVLARVTGAMRVATGAVRVYVYVFGERVPHLHFNLAPQQADGVLAGGPGLLRPGAEELGRDLHVAAARAIAGRMSEGWMSED
ncbi:MAG TPA: hypothetical protein VF062_23745 [Candidatus Limnocylindrales bacterium]